MNPALAAAALDLVGVPFRLHGRDAATGLDCVGLVAAALERCHVTPSIPRGYTLRSAEIESFLHHAHLSGLVETHGVAGGNEGGDVVLAAVHRLQPHLLIAVPDGFVHAHAGIGRVTVLPGPLPWRPLRQWRLVQAKD